MAAILAAFLFRAAALLASILATEAGVSLGVAEIAETVGSRLSSCGSGCPAQKSAMTRLVYTGSSSETRSPYRSKG